MKKTQTYILLLILLLSHIFTPLFYTFVNAETKEKQIKVIDTFNEQDDLSVDILLQENDWDKMEIQYPKLSEFKMSNLEDVSVENVDLENRVVTLTNDNNVDDIKVIFDTNKDFIDGIIEIKVFKKDKLVLFTEHNIVRPLVDKQDINNMNALDNNEDITLGESTELTVQSINDLNADFKIVSLNNKVQSGNRALFKLIVKTTGSQLMPNKGTMTIKLPTDEHIIFNQNLNDLSVFNSIPEYDEKNRSLNYHFDSIIPGETYERTLMLETKNGHIVNGKKLSVEGKMIINDEKTFTDSDSTLVVASNEVSINSSIGRIEKNQEATIPTIGSWIEWKTKVNIPKKDKGQMYLDPNHKLLVEATIPDGLTFQKMSNNAKKPISIKNGKLTWELDVPTLLEQEATKDSLFTYEISYWTKVNNDPKIIGQTLKSESKLSATFIDNKIFHSQMSTSNEVEIFESEGYTDDVEGGIVFPVHYGPSDGKGNGGNNANKDPNPIVGPDAYLQFRHNIWGFRYSLEDDLKEFKVSYTIDDNLILQSFKTPGDDWRYAPTLKEFNKNLKLPVDPEYDIVISYKDSNELHKLVLEEHIKGKEYTLKELGLSKDAQVKKIEYIFKGIIPKGLTNNNSARYYFTVKPGYSGTVTNKFDMSGKSTYNPKTGKHAKGTYYAFNHRDAFNQYYTGKGSEAGDRTAVIGKIIDKGTPISRININLIEEQGSLVEIGKNKAEVIFTNDPSVETSIVGPLEAVILMPPNVVLNSNPNLHLENGRGNITTGNYEVLNDNYNNSGRQLIKVKWNEDYIRPNEQLKAIFDIEILENAPELLYFEVYGYFGNKNMRVPNNPNPQLTDTIIQQDLSEDLNQDGSQDKLRIKSGNKYQVIGKYDLQTEKFVRTADSEWSKMAKAIPGEKVEYKLSMTNTTGKDISSMTLIEVLPSIGDIGITDNVQRGSKFSLKLTGPITLPIEWQGKVDVFYSKSKNPKRDELIRHTNYPEGTAQLSNPSGAEDANWMTENEVLNWEEIYSFKLELQPGKEWIKGQEINILFDMIAPKVSEVNSQDLFDINKDIFTRAAYNSFAVATDTGQPVEPHQVGVYMNAGKLNIMKVDGAQLDKRLENAVFDLIDDSGNVIEQLKTNKNGIANSKPLDIGKYKLIEIKSPTGYKISTKPISFEITGQNLEVDLVLENFETGWLLPNTSGRGTLVYYIAGLVLMLSSSFIYIRSIRLERG